MALVEDAGTEDAQVGARARVALPRLREPRVRRGAAGASGTSCRTRGSWIEDARLGGQPRPRALGARHGRRPLRAIPGGRASAASSSTPRCRRSRRSRARARGPTRCSASTSTCARSRATAACSRCARTLAERLLDLFRRTSAPRLAVVRGPRHVLQRAPVAGAARRPGRGWSDEEMTAAGLRSLEWLASIQRSRGRLLRADRLERLLRARRAARRRSTSSRVEACAMVSACLEAQRVDRRRALGGARAPRLRLVPRTEPPAAAALRRRRPAAAATGCTPIASTRTRARNRRSPSCSRSCEMRSADRAGATRRRSRGRRMT